MATSCTDTDDLLGSCLTMVFGDEDDVSATQISSAAKVATVLSSAKRFEVLDKFVSSLPDRVLKLFLKNEQFRRALIDLRRHQELYEDVCELIKSGSFSDGSELLDVWDSAHYCMWEQQYSKPLSSLTRFRIRKRNPPPPSICQGGRRSRNLGDSARAVLTTWLHAHAEFPYPTLSERHDLTRKTGLTQTQVRTWFANARRRRQQAKEKNSKEKCSRGRQHGTTQQVQKDRESRKASATVAQARGREGGGNEDVTAKSGGGGKARGGVSAREDQHLQWQPVQSYMGFPQYLHPSTAPVTALEPTGLSGLLRMCDRLTAQGPRMVSAWHPPDHPYSRLYPSPLPRRLPSHPQPPVYTFSQYCPPPSVAPRLPQATGIPYQTQTSPLHPQSWQSFSGIRHVPGSALLPAEAEGMIGRESREGCSGEVYRMRLEHLAAYTTTGPSSQAGQLQALASPVPATVFLSPTSLSPAATATTATVASSSNPLLCQYLVVDGRVGGESPLETVRMTQSPASLGVDMRLNGSSAFSRDQCLAMWNNSLLSSQSPHSSQTSEPEAADVAQGVEAMHSGFSRGQHLEGFSFPQALYDTFLVLHPAASGDSSPVSSSGVNIMADLLQTTSLPSHTPVIHSPHNMERTEAAEDVDEAALILLDLATTKTGQ